MKVDRSEGCSRSVDGKLGCHIFRGQYSETGFKSNHLAEGILQPSYL